MKNIIYILLLLSFSISPFAAEPMRRSLSDNDFVLIRETEFEFGACLQQTAMRKINENPDFRKVAAVAVDDCRGLLENLGKELKKNQLDPDFYYGIIENIKNKAIRQLIPRLMMKKAESQ